MAFYTNVLRFKNNIFYRGYDAKGQRVMKKEMFKPTFFVSSKEQASWKGLDGNNVSPLDFPRMYEANQWQRQNIDVVVDIFTAIKNLYNNTLQKSFHVILSSKEKIST